MGRTFRYDDKYERGPGRRKKNKNHAKNINGRGMRQDHANGGHELTSEEFYDVYNDLEKFDNDEDYYR